MYHCVVLLVLYEDLELRIPVKGEQVMLKKDYGC